MPHDLLPPDLLPLPDVKSGTGLFPALRALLLYLLHLRFAPACKSRVPEKQPSDIIQVRQVEASLSEPLLIV